MAKAEQPQKIGFKGRMRQIGMVFSYTAKRDKVFLPLVIGVGLVPVIGTVLLLIFVGGWLWIPLGTMLTLLTVLIVLNLRSNKAMMNEAKGQPGAAASIVETMRGDWRVTPALASTTQFDMVHLVIGRPGVILLGEGNPSRVKALLGQERKRLSKVIGSAEIRDFIVGEGEGEISVSKLRNTLMKLPRTISARDVNAIDKRLKALSARPQMPKGAIPKSMRPQNLRTPRR